MSALEKLTPPQPYRRNSRVTFGLFSLHRLMTCPRLRPGSAPLAAWLIALIVVIAPAKAQDPPAPKFEPAAACANCHAREYREWRASWMSRAFTNEAFQKEYALMGELAGTVKSADRRRCLRCHAPMALITRDTEVKNELSRDGVTCDLCHTIAVIRDRPGVGGLGIDPRGVRYGANTKPGIDPHPMAPSAALRDPRLCAACHHDVLPGDIPLERTYDEWQSSPYAKAGVVCVDCHMAPAGESDGRVSHRFAGGHATSPLLPGAAELSIRTPQAQVVDVEVLNARVGHHFPTAGAHPNRLLLDVTGYDDNDNVLWESQRVYQFRYLNAAGEEVHATEPVVSVADTTLAPLTPRIERFEPDGAEPTRRVRATLTYELVPRAHRARMNSAIYDEHYRPVEIDRAEAFVAE